MSPTTSECAIVVGLMLLISTSAAIAFRLLLVVSYGSAAKQESDLPQVQVPLYILVPCHSEWMLAQSTVSRYLQLVQENSNVSVIIVANSTSRHILGKELSLVDYLRTIVSDSSCDPDRVLVVEDRSPQSYKTTKLRAAVEIVYRRAHEQCAPLLGIVDFDTRLSMESIDWVMSAATKHPDVDVFQQIPYPTFDAAGSFYSRLWAVAQTERCLIMEAGRMVSPIRERFPSTLRPMRYLMGASLFIRLGALRSIGGVPDNSDDIVLGYRADLKGMRRALVPYPAFVAPPVIFRGAIRQLARILAGVWCYRREASRFFGDHRRIEPLVSTLSSIASASLISCRNLSAILTLIGTVLLEPTHTLTVAVLVVTILASTACMQRWFLSDLRGWPDQPPGYLGWSVLLCLSTVMTQVLLTLASALYAISLFSKTAFEFVHSGRTARPGE